MGWAAAAQRAQYNDQHKTAVGFAEAMDVFTTFPATFENQTIDNTTVLIKYTWYGDANLDGSVTLQDFNKMAANFGQQPRRWSEGDFNYDNVINLQDFNRLASNFGRSGWGPGDGTEEEAAAYTYEDLYAMWEEATG